MTDLSIPNEKTDGPARCAVVRDVVLVIHPDGARLVARDDSKPVHIDWLEVRYSLEPISPPSLVLLDALVPTIVSECVFHGLSLITVSYPYLPPPKTTVWADAISLLRKIKARAVERIKGRKVVESDGDEWDPWSDPEVNYPGESGLSQ